MPMTRIVPCVWLDDQAETAAAFYSRTFEGTRVVSSSRYPEGSANPSGRPPGSVLTVELELLGQRFTLLNGGPIFKPNPSVSFFVHVDTPAEVDPLYAALMEGGEALMPLDGYPWSERYAWVQDRFGVSWQLIAGRRPEGSGAVVPCLMFVGPMHGRAAEALRFLAGVFPGGRVEALEHYAAGEGPVEMVKHGRVLLDGQALIAMDAHGGHGFGFSEGLSLQVMCQGQAEVDRFWAALSDGGAPGQCGWLKDRFGFSWQVVPAAWEQWTAHSDKAAYDRAFAALLEMEKLDVVALERAFRGPSGTA